MRSLWSRNNHHNIKHPPTGGQVSLEPTPINCLQLIWYDWFSDLPIPSRCFHEIQYISLKCRSLLTVCTIQSVSVELAYCWEYKAHNKLAGTMLHYLCLFDVITLLILASWQTSDTWFILTECHHARGQISIDHSTV